MNRIVEFFKKELMLSVSLIAAVVSMFITPPSAKLLESIDWKTLATLFMLLSVLDGFKNENLFLPFIRFAGKLGSVVNLSLFLVFSVFVSSMFVTNDVSLIIFVPLTIILFRNAGKEKNIVPVIVMENIAAVRGSLLTPFGSPQNLFLFSASGIDTGSFLKMMLPLWIGSAVLLFAFVVVFHRHEIGENLKSESESSVKWSENRRKFRIVYLLLFAVVIASIVSRTEYWLCVTVFVAVVLFIFDRRVFGRVDYVLLLTFLCFFIFSSSIAANPGISSFLKKSVANNEYWWALGMSQIISNVPASIVLWPFTVNLKALIYGLDTAGLISIIGSLASVINMRIYTREYPGNAKYFMVEFEKISLLFFIIVLIPQFIMI